MTATRRVLITVGAPLILVVGLGAIWSARSAARLKARVEAFADSLEHSANPVTMHVGFLPVYLDGQKIGKLDDVTVLRVAPGTVDSLHVAIRLRGAADREALAACALHFDPDAFDQDGPLGYKRALTCAADTAGLVRFGSVVFGGVATRTPLYLDSGDLPCEHMSDPDAAGCTEVQIEIQRMRDQVRREAHRIRTEVREGVRN